MHGFEMRAVSLSRERRPILADISLTIAPGQHIALLGPSGAGKSTLVRLLAGLDTLTAGEIYLDGALASSSHAVHIAPGERAIGMVFQDLGLWANMTVAQNVALGLTCSGERRSDVHQRTRAILESFGLAPVADRSPAEISGGEQQRTALARALVGSPRFLIFDEPFSGIDLTTKQALFTHIRQALEREELVLVLITHDPLDALALCKEAIVIEQGRVVEQGHLRPLLREPGSSTLAAMRAALESHACPS